MPDPRRVEGDEAPVGAPPGVIATPETMAEAIRRGGSPTPVPPEIAAALSRGTLAQQQLTAYPNARRQTIPSPTPMPPGLPGLPGPQSGPGLPPAPAIASNPVTGVPAAPMPSATTPPPLPPLIPGLGPQQWADLPIFQRWLSPRPAGINFPEPIGPGMASQPFLTPSSLEQNNLGVANPKAAMALVLRQRGISPDTTLGTHYIQQADELRRVFEMSAQQGLGLQTGQTVQSPDGYLAFISGYIDRMQDTGGGGRQDITALRGIVRAQVHEALSNPNSDIYKQMADRMAQTQPGEYGGNADQFGNSPPELVLWFGLIRPALMAVNVSPAHVRGAQGEFMRHYRNYQEQVVAGGQGKATFQDYLTAVGYDPFK